MQLRAAQSANPLRVGLFAMLAFVGGTAAQMQQSSLFSAEIYCALLLLALASIAILATKKLANGVWGLFGIVGFALLAFSLCGLRSVLFLDQSLDARLQGQDLAVTGVVAAMVQHNDAGARFRFDVESAQTGGVAVALPPSIYLNWYNGVSGSAAGVNLQRQPGRIAPGERWRMTVRLKAPHGASNPHGFDFELWLWEQGLQATGYVRAGPRDAAPERLAQTRAHPIEQARQRVRDAVFERLQDRRVAGIVAALVVGDQNAIDQSDWDVFRAAGVAHLMSISGLHVTMFAWGAALTLGWLWRRSSQLCLAWPASHAALVGGMLLALAYSLFSGWGVPAQRTVLMLATVSALRLSGRRWPWPHSWMLACAVVVLADPWAIMQAGFWLSFVAVGVLFATNSPQNDVPQVSLDARVRSLLREQWVVTLSLTPLTLLLFGQVSMIGLLANMVAIPWVTLVVTPLAMLGGVFAPVWDLTAWAVQGLAWCLSGLASLPFSTVSIARAPLWAGIAGVLGGLLLVMRLPWSARMLGVPLLLPVLLWQAPRPADGHFEMVAADIGQGNAVIVRTAHHALVYDAGPRFSRESDAGHRVVVPLLRALDARVDKLILSHRDADHIGGAKAVLTMHPKAELLSSIEEQHELQLLRKSRRCESGQRWHWDGVDFEVLHPPAGDYDLSGRSNAMSCVLRISSAGASRAGSSGAGVALLAGDIEAAQEARLVAGGASIQADFLLVPHHGSKTSSSAEFLDAVHPRIAVVQAGFRNRFDHPAASVMERYAARGIRVEDSPQCGAATWSSAQPDVLQCHRQQARRYWQHDLAGERTQARVNAGAQTH